MAGGERAVERARGDGRFVRMKLAGIERREDAQRLRGEYLQVATGELKDLGEGEFYRFQLLGLCVRGIDGRELGRIVDVFSSPANDVYVVQGPLGEILVPAIDDIVRSVDMEQREMTIEMVPGLLADAKTGDNS